MTPARPSEPYDSMNSDQPTTPSSVLILRNAKSRQPALQCKSSILVMRMLPSLGPMLGGREQGRKGWHVGRDRGRAGRAQALGVTGATMLSAGEANGPHAGGHG